MKVPTTTAMIGRSRSLPSSRTIILAIAVISFVLLCLLPILYMFGVSFVGTDGSFSLEKYHRLLFDERQRRLLLNSVFVGAGATTLATLIGSPIGLLLARTNLPAKALLRLVLVVPLVIPPYILGLAWIYIGGSAGLVAQIFGRDLLSNWTYSPIGAIVILGVCFFPLSMLATEAAARRVAANLEEAALLITPPHRVLWRVTLPLIAPGVAAATLIIFVLALSDFGVPSLLRVPVFTTEAFTAFAALYDFGTATALSVPLILIALIAGLVVRLFIGDRVLAGRRAGRIGLGLSLGSWRSLAIAWLVFVIMISVLLPLVVLGREVGQMGRLISAVSSSEIAIGNSLLFSAIGATIIVLLAVLLGYGVASVRSRFGHAAEIALIVIFAVPSTVVGIGLIDLWNRPNLLGEVYKTSAIIIIAYLARFVSVAALILAASMRQVPPSLEEAAEVSGASWPRTFAQIIVPQVGTGVLAAWVVAFIFAFSELGATVLVTPPGESTLPVHIYTMIANAPSSEVAALALVQGAIVVMALSFFGVFVRTTGEKR